MKRNVSNHSYRDEKLKSSRSENYETGLRRTEEERLRRRREWIIEQQMLREHERLKEKKILEYEIRRALEKGLPLPKGRFSHHSSNKSKSKSPESQHRTVATLSTSNTSILSKKLEPSDGTTPLFKGPEGIQVTAAELRRIKVYIHRNSFTEDIHRNVPDEATTDDLQRDIINFEDVLVKRREGEGSKSIFEREEIKSVTVKTEETVEHRTVVAINNENLENKPEANKYTTFSRSRSPQYRSSHHTRYMLYVTIVCFVLAYACFFFFFWMYQKWKLGEKGIKIQNIITGIVTEMIETEIIVEVEVESIKKKSGHIVNCTLQRKSTCEKEKVIEIIHIQGEENKEHGSKILMTASHLNTKDLIEKNRESDSEKEEKEISLENVDYLHHIILNPFLFLFIMEVFLRDQ